MSTLLVPWSTTLVVLPAVTALVTSRLTDRRRARTLSVVSAGIGLALAVGLLLSVFGLGGERALLADPLAFAPLGPRPLFGLDLISAPLVVLVGLTTLACVWGTPANEGQARTLTRIMALQAATLAALVSLHAELFAVAWLLTLVPVVLELRARGATRMAKVFLLYQGLGWFALAIAFWSYGGAALFDGGQQGAGMEVGLLVAVVLAAAARQGLLPFHSWLPSLHEQVPPGITALTFVPQLGGYLLVRLLAGSPGAENLEVLQVVVVLGAATAVYAALLGVIQTDLRRSVGWLAVSQSALVMCGLAADGSVGLTGGLLLCGSSGLALTGLLLTVSAIEARFGPVDCSQPRGLAGRTPALGVFFLLLGFASVGFPGTLGFVAEDLLFHGTLESWPAAGLALVLATALNGFCILRLYYYVFQGGRPALPRVEDALPRERVVLLVLVVLLLMGGLFPRALVAGSARGASQIRNPSSQMGR